ncbi:MAG: hypothetical protein J0G94_11380, partial [Sphingomonadales bacterium]|nr:hypothetical protein [Sphingomonadales bacterium]
PVDHPSTGPFHFGFIRVIPLDLNIACGKSEVSRRRRNRGGISVAPLTKGDGFGHIESQQR